MLFHIIVAAIFGCVLLQPPPVSSAEDDWFKDDDPPVSNVNEEGDTDISLWDGITNLDEYPGPLGRVDERIPDPECPRCFTAPGFSGSQQYQIFESIVVNEREHIVAREIPNPAPLKEGEVRETVDEDTGEPIWYIGTQAYIGPTDEEPFSEHHGNRSKIDMLRIKFRNEDRIFAIPGVHSFGIGTKGFEVSIRGEQATEHKAKIPATIEGVPVEVTVEGISPLSAHSRTRFRPVPTGAGIGSQWWVGTLGPPVVSTTGGCCRIWSLTAGHVVKASLSDPTPALNSVPVYQPGTALSRNLFAYVLHAFQLDECGTWEKCNEDAATTNRTNADPDIALLDPIPTGSWEWSPFNTPAGTDPTRHMQHGAGADDYINGPSGVIWTAESGDKHVVWGAYTAASDDEDTSVLASVGITRILGQGTRNYKMCCLNLLNSPFKDGDSGSLIAYAGRGRRHVAGVGIGARYEYIGGREVRVDGVYYVPARDILTALSAVGRPISHMWGTKSIYRPPSTKTCDLPDGC